MPNIFLKMYFTHPDQEFGWSERYYLIGQTDLPGARETATKLVLARSKLCARDVLIRYSYVSAEGVFRDRLYVPTPGYTVLGAKSGQTTGSQGTNTMYALNPDLVPDGDAAEPEVAAVIRMNNRDGTQHGRIFMRGLPGKYFQTDPDAFFSPSGTWRTAFANWAIAAGAGPVDAGALVGFKGTDKTSPRLVVTGMTYLAGILTINFTDPPGAVAAGLGAIPPGGLRIGRAEGTGLRVNKVWPWSAFQWVNAYKITLALPAPGFTWTKGGYLQAQTSIIAPASTMYWVSAYYTEHDTGRGYTPHKARRRKRTPDITF